MKVIRETVKQIVIRDLLFRTIPLDTSDDLHAINMKPIQQKDDSNSSVTMIVLLTYLLYESSGSVMHSSALINI